MTNELAMAIDAEIKGLWLRLAVEAQGDTLQQCATKLGMEYPTTVYSHANSKSFMGAKLLAGLAKVYPTMNLHFVLTGVGNPRLSVSVDNAMLTDDARTAYEATRRILDQLGEST
ncbi:hypothetical protein [Spirosoma validum]|uniref:Uncharacterized protein n=1 Tax=Spirosoma validum TaxID=2771355 RepID=A0A927B1M2_9BACT|nr:hypothetical protein [Spirosoma validum]MBD2753719.1 hypothetical protein [Spirosoma validum]